ncbi:hypothetical protein SASPL_132962 [Salvia splendens]|uniref:Uncharacterized protein n=1 Tax=Salvia splendens TaxID=180675 RepID=A0A8X8ZHZ7_SALSN|nr:hypothetical protein SASPL_132962 [Salvia splendens]
MVLRCAGKSAQNAGRYYLKCSVNGKHPGSFKWYDEVASDTMFQTCNLQTERGKQAQDVPGTDSRSEPKTSALITGLEVYTIRMLEWKTNVLILFTGLFLYTKSPNPQSCNILLNVDERLREWYFYQEEPIYARLACVFGLDDVKVKGQTTVVVMSDNTKEVHSDSIKINDVIEGEEEVNSPVVFPGPKVHRKLFDEDAEPNDRESTTEDGDRFIDLGSDGYMRYREEKGRMLPKPPGPSHKVSGP